jgi:hypothetical protein
VRNIGDDIMSISKATLIAFADDRVGDRAGVTLDRFL